MACLEEIERLGGSLDLLITLSDETALKKSGRIYLDDYARRIRTPLHKTTHINDAETLDVIRQASLDYLLVIGWSQLLSAQIFTLVRRSLYGMHPTLLLQGRGRAPIPWTILKGLKRTGVSMFELGSDADSGLIVGAKSFDVDPYETAKKTIRKGLSCSCGPDERGLAPSCRRNTQRYSTGRKQSDTLATKTAGRRPNSRECNHRRYR